MAGIPALLLVALAVTGYTLLRHFNNNLDQVNVTAMLGSQPRDLHPKAENILVIGSHAGFGPQGASALDNQSGTLILLHIAADKKWARVVAIPPDSRVSIPACTMGNGAPSAARQAQVSLAFGIGSLHGGSTANAAACTVKTVEQDTGIYVDHFIVINFTGFQKMVTALGGVPVYLPAALDYPAYGIDLPAGRHVLDGTQALGYVRALSTAGNSDVDRLSRQTAFISDLLSRAKTKWDNPLAIYRFLDAVTGSLTIDSKLGGITGLYNLERTVHGMPLGQVSTVVLPSHPDGSSVLWTQPEDGKIFAALRNDVKTSIGS